MAVFKREETVTRRGVSSSRAERERERKREFEIDFRCRVESRHRRINEPLGSSHELFVQSSSGTIEQKSREEKKGEKNRKQKKNKGRVSIIDDVLEISSGLLIRGCSNYYLKQIFVLEACF